MATTPALRRATSIGAAPPVDPGTLRGEGRVTDAVRLPGTMPETGGVETILAGGEEGTGGDAAGMVKEEGKTDQVVVDVDVEAAGPAPPPAAAAAVADVETEPEPGSAEVADVAEAAGLTGGTLMGTPAEEHIEVTALDTEDWSERAHALRTQGVILLTRPGFAQWHLKSIRLEQPSRLTTS